MPHTFTFMGQKFTIDSWVFSNVTYDRLVNDVCIPFLSPLPLPPLLSPLTSHLFSLSHYNFTSRNFTFDSWFFSNVTYDRLVNEVCIHFLSPLLSPLTSHSHSHLSFTFMDPKFTLISFGFLPFMLGFTNVTYNWTMTFETTWSKTIEELFK